MVDPKIDSSSSGPSSSVVSGQITGLNDNRIASLKKAGYSDAQIEALLSLSNPDDQGKSVTPNHFYSVNKQTLNALQYTGQLDSNTQKLVYLQAPISMVQEVSNPGNWQGDNYIGPGASSINSYILGEPVDFTKPSLDAMVMSVLTARADILQVQLESKIESISNKNTRLDEANQMLARAREKKAAAGTSGTTTMDADMVKFWNKMGAKIDSTGGDTIHNSKNWDVNIEGLKGKIEALTSQSQLETTKLQQNISKYNQTFEMLSNFISKYYQSLGSIIQNLR